MKRGETRERAAEQAQGKAPADDWIGLDWIGLDWIGCIRPDKE